MQELADMELLRRYADQNSETAFEILVQRHLPLVYSAALRKTGSPSNAEEVTQAVFIILARKAHTLRGGTVLSGWLYQATRLTAANFLRNEIRRVRREQEAFMESHPNELTPELWPQIMPLIEDAMGRLGDKERNAIVLRFFEGKSFPEIGEAVGVSENAAQKRVATALEKIKGYFRKRGIDSSTATLAETISANSIQAAPVALAKTISAVAITKGAAISGSTLSLVKGALKLMAWSKLKTAAVTGAIVMMAASAVIATDYFSYLPFMHSGRQALPTGQVTPSLNYGFSHNIVVLASDGSLWTWGEERLGWPVLGLNGVQNTTSLQQIGKDMDWRQVSVGDSASLAIKGDGSLWAWGGNYTYQLGDGTKINRLTPVRSVPGNDWVQAATSGDISYAIKDDGSLWTWGSGYYSGNGNTKQNKKAVQVGHSNNWKKVWASDVQTVALQTDGSLWFWGSPTGDTSAILTPTRISPDTNWVDVCFGYFTMFALKSDGTLWSWGREANYYTGQDPSTNLKPMQVGTENDWQSCRSGSGFYHLLQKTDGSLWALDASDHAFIKPDSGYKPIKLVKINFDKDIAAFTAGGINFGAVLTRDGQVWTWGNVYGTHKQSDFFGPGPRDQKDPTFKVKMEPWQMSISE